MRSLQDKSVQITADQVSSVGNDNAIRAGEFGTVVWDEPDGDVIVEFGRVVPNGGLLLSDRQAWIPRSSVVVVD